MTKVEFIGVLRQRLAKLPDFERSKTISFYAEIIDDRMEDGMSEADAVASLGSIDQIVSDTLVDTPWSTLIQGKIKESKKRAKSQSVWKILAICGIPIWVPLAFAFACIIFALYLSVGAVVVSLFAVELSLAVASVGGILSSFFLILRLNIATGFAMLGMSVACAGLFIMSFMPLKWLSKQFVALAGVWIRKMKTLFITKKEDVE